MKTLIHDRVEQAQAGENPYAICKVSSGWVVLGDYQFIPGYFLLLPDPVVGQLNDLTVIHRSQFLTDMAAVGDALLDITGAHRINYEILGNADRALHAHIFTRYSTEPSDKVRGPVADYARVERISRPFDRERDRPTMNAIRDYLEAKGIAQHIG